MTAASIRAILLRELATFRDELAAYPDDAAVWATPPGIVNPAGTLALHVAGNLRHLVGAQLGNTGYERDRDAEFARRGLGRAELTAELDAAIADVDRALAALPDDRLGADYPLALRDHRYATGDLLLHLAAHLAYHLGQLDYHRRVVTGEAGRIAAMAPGALHSARRVGLASSGP